MTTATHRLPLAITMGDPAGIGPEIVLRCMADSRLPGPALVIGDPAWLARQAQRLGFALRVREIDAPEALRTDSPVAAPTHATGAPRTRATGATRTHAPGAARFEPADVPVLAACRVPPELPLGRVDARAGRAAADCIERAVALAATGRVAAVVTAPIHKEALAACAIPYPGHTEMLAALAGVAEVRMMLVNDELRTILVSIHVSLADAIGAVTRSRVLATIRMADVALRRAGIERPRIAVAGLNPHAGEGGLFGREEIDAIAPAIEEARAAGIDASGPWPGDTVFMRARGFGAFDIVVAQYHDQGLIPIKYLGLDTGVNVTVGLPFVRTSVDHGTAFDIAGRGLADHRSLLAACRVARELAGEADTEGEC